MNLWQIVLRRSHASFEREILSIKKMKPFINKHPKFLITDQNGLLLRGYIFFNLKNFLLTTDSNILITGAAGFIASCMASYLNAKGYKNLILVDDFTREDKKRNFDSLEKLALVERNQLTAYLQQDQPIDLVIHFGARTDTTEMDYSVHEQLNLIPSKILWTYCTEKQIPFIYASSAATYGSGQQGYDDDHEGIEKLEPLNPYGVSKNEFDKFVLLQIREVKSCPPNWYGLKFFNVYGPNEYHKGRMASVIFHAYHQIMEKGSLRLFRSHRPDFEDGGQMRDFIYVKDLLDVTFWLMNHLPENGLYNLGTGKAATFLELANSVFLSLDKEAHIEFIDTPIDIREKYQVQLWIE